MTYEYNLETHFNHENCFLFFYAAFNSNCTINKQLIENLSKTHKDVVFIKINTTSYYDLKKEFNVTMIPTYIFLKDNVEVDRIEGNVSSFSLKKFVEENRV